MSFGREISPYYRNASHYLFNELASNTSHTIEVAFTDGVNVDTVSAGHVNTLASLRKFPSSFNMLDSRITCIILTYIQHK